MKEELIKGCTLLLLLLLPESTALFSQEKKIPELETNPVEIGKRVADNVISRRFGWRYQKVCSYYGALIFADASGKEPIALKVEEGFAPYHTGKKRYKKGHVDFNVFGIWPLELYRQTGNKSYFSQGLALADDEYKDSRPDGLSELTRWWVDDMYMVGSLQVQAYRNTGEQIYLDRAALQLFSYADSLQKPNGLFFHRPDAPLYWGRGNGWAAAAMAEVLLALPEDHKLYEGLLAAYRKMMKGLLAYQSESGMWHQLIDKPYSFEEPSCTGMFLFAMITGLDLGLLPFDEYMGAVERGWNALCKKVNENGEVVDVCMWTNARKREGYYLHRPRITGDYHGQCAFLWASTAMIRFLDLEE